MMPSTPSTVRALEHHHHRAADVPDPFALHPFEQRAVAVYSDVTNVIRDKPGSGFSMTKLIAAYFAYLSGVSIHELHGVVTTNALALAFASGAIAFGKSTFNFLLSKYSMAGTSTQNDTRTLERKEVDSTTRIDAHYTVDGSGANVPAFSLPPVPGAKTPSGDD